MDISADKIKKLREKTGVGMMACKEALQEACGDMEKAIEILRKKGQATAEKKATRETNQGRIESYIHPGDKLGVLVEVNCETDFVAKCDDFKTLCREIAMQIAASSPQYISKEDVPEEVILKEKEIYKEQLLREGKPEKIIDKIIEGKLQKFYDYVCLLEQPYIREEKRKVKDIISDLVGKVGENIKVKRFVRFKVGEY